MHASGEPQQLRLFPVAGRGIRRLQELYAVSTVRVETLSRILLAQHAEVVSKDRQLLLLLLFLIESRKASHQCWP